MVYAPARIEEGGAADLLQKLAAIYMGPGIKFPPPMDEPPPGYITRIQVEAYQWCWSVVRSDCLTTQIVPPSYHPLTMNASTSQPPDAFYLHWGVSAA